MKLLYILVLCMLFSLNLKAEEKSFILYYNEFQKECPQDKASYTAFFNFSDYDKKTGTIQIFNQDGNLVRELKGTNIGMPSTSSMMLLQAGKMPNSVQTGNIKSYYHNGILKEASSYYNFQRHGGFSSYYPSGQQKRGEIYDQGTLIVGNCYTRTGKDTTYYESDRMPEFPGGQDALMSYLGAYVNYPIEAQQRGIQGNVLVSFIITSEGEITEAKVGKSIHPLLDEEALRVINAMPKWIPAIQDGNRVNTRYMLPVNFILK